jgi:ribonuclease-3
MNRFEKLFQKFGIKPRNISLYEEAFIHTSYAYEHRLAYSYEKLEFLGDAVISLVVGEHLYRSHLDMATPGELSKARIIMVQSKTLIKAAKELGLDKLTLLGGAVQKSKNISEKIYEDVFEAFIGAVYLDQGINVVRTVLKRTIIHYYEIHSLNAFQDFKSLLQEYMQKFSKYDITYKTVINQKDDY